MVLEFRNGQFFEALPDGAEEPITVEQAVGFEEPLDGWFLEE